MGKLGLIITATFSCKYSISLIAACLLCVIIAIPAEINAKYASIIIDTQSGKIRHSVNAETRNYPASLTKLMTLLLLFEALEQKKLKLTSNFKVSHRAARQPASKLGLRVGQNLAVRDAISALIIKSANDVATVVAENLAGNERRFALLMTDKARKIGMARTTFRNASGLSHRGQMSTASDMAKLTLELINKYPKYYHLFAKTSFSFKGRTYRSHNKLLKNFPGAEGMKTGYIRASGYNLITTAKRNGLRLVGVIFGGNSARARDRHMKKLLNRAFTKHSAVIKISPTFYEKATKNQSNLSSSKNASLSDSGKYLWGIQIGAFNTRKPAIALASKLFNQYKKLLANGQIAIMPMKMKGKETLYRSRILSISMRSAYKICRLLKRKRQPCIPLRLPQAMEIASR